MSTNKYRIFLIDEQPVFRLGMRHILEATGAYLVVGEASTGSEAISAMHIGGPPDLVIVDISIPEGSGLELIKRLRGLYPNLHCLVVSKHFGHLYTEHALRAGARGYLRKSASRPVILSAVEKAVRGEIALGEGATTKFFDSVYRREGQSTSRYYQLSEREFEVFEMLGRGMKTGSIASALTISTKTVERHQAGIKQKLGVPHMGELRRVAAVWMSGPSDRYL